MKIPTLQDVVKTYLKDKGIKVRKYKEFLRVNVLHTHVNILAQENSIFLVTGPMTTGHRVKMTGSISDPTNQMLDNLVSLCKQIEHLDRLFGYITGVPFDSVTK